MPTIRFTNTTTGGVTESALWNFGDGSDSTSLATNVDHFYAAGGDYTTSLHAISTTDATGDATHVVTVTVNPLDPILWWRADDSPAESVHGLATTWNATPAYQEGAANRAFQFNIYNYSTDYKALTTPNSSYYNFGPTDQFSLRFWMRANQYSGAYGQTFLVIKGDSADSQPPYGVYGIHFDWGILLFNNSLRVVVQGNEAAISNFAYPDDGLWHDIIWTYDDGTHNIYMDEVLKVGPVASVPIPNRSYDLNFAATQAASYSALDLFYGGLDEIKFYNYLII